MSPTEPSRVALHRGARGGAHGHLARVARLRPEDAMKVQCSGCAARYAIDDEKLHGRSARIRCKRCGDAIVVRSEPSEHFVLVGEAQRGPLGRDELERAIRAGEVGRDALVWHEGLAEWTALGEVPSLAACLPAAAHTGARDESSVLFSLGTLRELASAPTRPAVTDGSGLIDIRALAHTPAPAPAPAMDLFAGVGGPSPGVPWVSIATPPRPRNVLLPLAAAMVVASILVVGAFVLGRGTRGAEPPAVGSVVEPPRALVSSEPAPPVAEPSAPPSPAAPTLEASAPEPPEPDADLEPREARRSGERARPARAEAPPPPLTPVVPARAEATDLESLLDRAALPDTPSREAVRWAMEGLAPGIRACGEGAHGSVLVRVVLVGESGRVRSASVDRAPAGTEACMERVVRELSLAPFARPSFTVLYPFVL